LSIQGELMQTEIVISGFGGQGVLFAGQLLAYAALESDKHVTWFPSYGPEMRGGTAHCTVIISDEEIGSPVVKNPQGALVMNLPSLDKYEPLVRKGGVLIVNSSLVDRSAKRDDIQVVEVPANEIAEELGYQRLANLVMVGALLQMLPVLEIKSISEALELHISDRHRELIEVNKKALERGTQFAESEKIIA
jgi:2-oxoglutarate ferredoxin oxidoreductase subunit gamma